MASKDTLAGRLKELRKKHGHTQSDLGALLHVDKMTVSGWETRKKEPSFEMLDKIAETYHVSVSSLFSAGDETSLPAVAYTQAEVFRCVCALAASQYFSSAEIQPSIVTDEDGWEHTVGQNIVLSLCNANTEGSNYIVNKQLYDRCTAALSLAKVRKTGAMTDAIFESAVNGVVSSIAEKEASRRETVRGNIINGTNNDEIDDDETDDDELPF